MVVMVTMMMVVMVPVMLHGGLATMVMVLVWLRCGMVVWLHAGSSLGHFVHAHIYEQLLIY